MKRLLRFRLPLVAALAVLMLGVAACQQAAAQPVTVQVDAGDMYIKASLTSYKAGVPYHFVLKNNGKVAHEVMLMPVVTASSGMTMEDMDKVALGKVEMEEFVPGASGSFDFTFTKAYGPGELELACHVPGHYESGMRQAITVTN